MQDPSWSDVLAYATTRLTRGDWPYATYAAWGAIAALVSLVRVLVAWAWKRHRIAQQVASIRTLFFRWNNSLGQPFWTLSTDSQLAAVARLRTTLEGDVDMVIALLIGLRVHLEHYILDERVMQAIDRMTADWQGRTWHARRREYLKLRELGKAMASQRPSEAGPGEAGLPRHP